MCAVTCLVRGWRRPSALAGQPGISRPMYFKRRFGSIIVQCALQLPGSARLFRLDEQAALFLHRIERRRLRRTALIASGNPPASMIERWREVLSALQLEQLRFESACVCTSGA